MASLTEFRQKYPQYDDMSDEQLAGALHKKFYSDMPYDQFVTKIGLTAEKPPEEVAKPKHEPYTGMILPWATDEEGNSSLAVPRLVTGLIDSAKEAVSAPYRAYTGELRMTDETGRTSDEAIAEGFNMATWATPTSIASGTGKQIARDFAAMNPRVPSEGARVAQAAADLGVTLPRAVTSDSAVMNQLGKTVANVPVAGLPLRKAATKAIEQVDDAAKRTQDSLGSGDRLIAGERVRSGLKEYNTNVLDTKIDDMEAELASTMQPDKLSALPNTKKLVQDLIAERQRNAETGKSRAITEVEEALSRDGMTFDGLRAKRAKIRRLRDVNPDDLTTNDIDQAELDRLYKALTEDLKFSAKNAGGDEAVEKFNTVVQAEAKIAEERKALTRVLGRNLSDEALSDKLFRMAGDKSSANVGDLMRVRKAVSDDTWNDLSSSVLAKMGRDAEGRFTPDRFVTEWGKLTDGGKSLLFGGETKKALEDIATVSSRFKKMNQYANPSGTGQTLMTGALGSVAYVDPMTALQVAIPAYATAKFLASPARAKAVADYAKAYELAAKSPNQMTQNLLADKAKTLALIAANGNERNASNLAANLATVKQTAAQPEDNEEVRRPEGNPEPDKASDDFNQAYLQGRAL